jgi:uncharacterized protein (DUF2126 family)
MRSTALACAGRRKIPRAAPRAFVDSSVERLQIRVEGMNTERYAVTCNGGRCPLVSTGRSGEFRRRRPLQGVGALFGVAIEHQGASPAQPFDIVGSLEPGISVAAASTLRAFQAAQLRNLPDQFYEAEARRLARFEAPGITPGMVDVPREERSPREYPTTSSICDIPSGLMADIRGAACN